MIHLKNFIYVGAMCVFTYATFNAGYQLIAFIMLMGIIYFINNKKEL